MATKTIMRMESVAGIPQSRTKTLLDIKAALEAGGIEFVGTPKDALPIFRPGRGAPTTLGDSLKPLVNVLPNGVPPYPYDEGRFLAQAGRGGDKCDDVGAAMVSTNPIMDTIARCQTFRGSAARMAASLAGDGRGRLITSNGSSRRALRPAHPLRR